MFIQIKLEIANNLEVKKKNKKTNPNPNQTYLLLQVIQPAL